VSALLVPLDDRWSLWPYFAVRGAGLPVDHVAAFAVPELLAGQGADLAERVRGVTAAAVCSTLADDTFLAALTWQNLPVVDTWAGRLAELARAGAPPVTARRNERERVIARYAQRYAAKNETIGFFGAVAWGEFTSDPAPVAWDGELGVRGGTVSFEVWAIRELARAWAEEAPVRPFVPVRLNPSCTVRGPQLLRPRRPPLELDDVSQALLAVLGDSRPYYQIIASATEMSGRPEVAVIDSVQALRAEGVVLIEFPVPFDEWPERHLRRQVERVPDDGVRALLTGRLDRLEQARDRVRSVAADPVRLRAALHELGDELVSAGGRAGRTLEGNNLGRSAVYLDCRRDLDVRVGTSMVEALAPLGVLLGSADWLSAQVAETVEEHLRDRFHELRRRKDSVTLSALQAAATEVLVPGNRLVAPVLADFQSRWAEILPATGTAPVALTTADVRTLADALFPETEPPWAAARHHTPDLMLHREPDGRYRWVLGELHVALNTLESRLFATQCERRAELVAATAADFSAGRIVPLYPPDGAANNSRTYPPPALDPPGAFRYWSFAADNGHEHGHRSVPATAIKVVETDGELVGVADGWQARVTEFFGEFLTALTVNLFRLRPLSAPAPRVRIDDLIVCRQSWHFRPGDIPLPRSRNRDYTYQCLRDWAARHGLSRHVFVHVPQETKPVYVDFAAPALLDNFARLVRAAPDDVGLTEMLPDISGLWLRDRLGRRYTTELRMVAVRTGPGDPIIRPSNRGRS
jgi:Lantibiotic dehydratase, N terminus